MDRNQREFHGLDCTVSLVERPDAFFNWCLKIRGALIADSYVRGTLQDAQEQAQRLITPWTDAVWTAHDAG